MPNNTTRVKGHNGSKCRYLLDEMASLKFDNFPDLEAKISKDIKMSFVYCRQCYKKRLSLRREKN